MTTEDIALGYKELLEVEVGWCNMKQVIVDELGMEGVSWMRDYVAQRRPQIRVEEERGPSQVFIPRSHRPGVEAEVDFGGVM
ncbi:hypothetical protein [Streptomyces sp. NPDC002088]|uniref:hypothetical protein n=1 Tax=Streptomyces sp. NPDC002088 TaxID=3154665 RepID=UPI00331C1CB5